MQSSIRALLAFVPMAAAIQVKNMDNPASPEYLQAPDDAPPSNLTFKYYLLNLDRRPDRLTNFAAGMQPSMKGNICRIKAADGYALGEADFAPGTPLHGRSTWPPQKADGWNDLKPGALGCFMSHTLAWDQIEKDDVDVGIVIEDDVKQWSGTFEQDLKKQVLNADNFKHYDVLLMSHCAGGLGENVKLHKAGTACTGMMAVKKNSIPLMKKELFPVREAIDSMMNLKLHYNRQDFNIYITEPKMADQDHSDTDIQKFRQLLNTDKAQQKKKLEQAHQDIPDCA